MSVFQVVGDPMPEKVSWYHNHKAVSVSNPDIEMSFERESGVAVLIIGEVFPQDTGLYECVAANVYGKASTQSQLAVEGLPLFE